eukprot:jgi/Mesen1/4934/ME000246S04160
MAWASPAKVVLGCAAFTLFWLTAVVPSNPCLPIGRTGGALLSAALMVVLQVLSADDAFAAIDLPVLALLFGTMLLSAYLEKADLFRHLGVLLAWKSGGGADLICRVALLSGLSSALLTNDTTCVVLTPFLLDLCKQHRLPPQPFLMALATSSNIGSAATPIGNPQNLVIALQSGVGFGRFVAGIGAAVVVGVLLNTAALLALYWPRLTSRGPDAAAEAEAAADSGDGTRPSTSVVPAVAQVAPYPTGMRREEEAGAGGVSGGTAGQGGPPAHDGRQQHVVVVAEEGTNNAGHALGAGLSAPRGSGSSGMPPGGEAEARSWKQWGQQGATYAVALGMLACFLAGLNLPFTAVAAAALLMCIGWRDATPMLDKVSYSLLVFFAAMFVAVQGFNATGAPGALWDAVEPHAHINSARGTAVLCVVVALLSNVASNANDYGCLNVRGKGGGEGDMMTLKVAAPFFSLLLLGPRLAAAAAATAGVSVMRAWLLLAWTSTVAGNLTMVGSAANLIVSEQARRTVRNTYDLSFWNHLRFGVPSTLIVMTAGVALVR